MEDTMGIDREEKPGTQRHATHEVGAKLNDAWLLGMMLEQEVVKLLSLKVVTFYVTPEKTSEKSNIIERFQICV